MTTARWLNAFVVLLIAVGSSGKLWSKFSGQASLGQVLEKSRTQQLDKSDQGNSVWDNYNRVNDMTSHTSHTGASTNTSDVSAILATPAPTETYLNLLLAGGTDPISTFPPTVNTTNSAVFVDAPAQLSDQPVITSGYLSPDERAIQNVIRDTIPKHPRNQNRWAGPMFSQSSDAALADSGGTSQRNGQSVQRPMQQLEAPWMRALAAPLLATSTATALLPVTMKPIPIKTGVKIDRRSGGTGIRVKPAWLPQTTVTASRPAIEARRRPVQLKSTGQFFATTPGSLTDSGSAEEFTGPRLISHITQSDHGGLTNKLLAQPKMQSSDSSVSTPYSASNFPYESVTYSSQQQISEKKSLRQKVEAMKLNPLAFASSADQWKRPNDLDIRMQLPPDPTMPIFVQPEVNQEFRGNPLQAVNGQLATVFNGIVPDMTSMVIPPPGPVNEPRQNDRKSMRDHAAAMMLDPLAFASSPDQWKRPDNLDVQVPPPPSGPVIPVFVQPEVSQEFRDNPLQSVSGQEQVGPVVARPPGKKQPVRKPFTGFRRRTPPPFYGHRRTNQQQSHGLSRQQAPGMSEAPQLQQFGETFLRTMQPVFEVMGNTQSTIMGAEPLTSTDAIRHEHLDQENLSSRQTTPFICPCLNGGQGNSQTAVTSIVQTDFGNADRDIQLTRRDPRDNNVRNTVGTGEGIFNNVIADTNNFMNNNQLHYPQPFQSTDPHNGGGFGSNLDVSRFAVGPATNSDSDRRQLTVQGPLNVIFGQPLQTTTPSQWQPFTPHWSTTDTVNSVAPVGVAPNLFVGGTNKQLQSLAENNGYMIQSQTLPYAVMGGNGYGTGGTSGSVTNGQTVVTPPYANNQNFQTNQVTQPMVPFGYGTTAQGIIPYSNGVQASRKLIQTGVRGCADSTQPPITVDIIQPVRRRLLVPVAPVCNQAIVKVQLDSSMTPGTVIGTVLATDPASNTLLWSIERDVTGDFGIDKFTGDFALTGSLSGINTAEVIVRATNPAGQYCQTLIEVTVNKMERSLGGPQFTNWFSQDVYNVTILCSLPNGTLIMQATARHPTGDVVRYGLDGTTEFSVNGTGFVSVAGLNIGKQENPLRSFRIIAVDSKGTQASSVVNVFLDVSTCYGPQFEMSAYIYDVQTDCGGVRSTDQIAQIQALPPSPASQLMYTLIGTTGFAIDSMSGIISSRMLLEMNQRLPDFGIVATDGYGRTDTATVRISIIVNCTQRQSDQPPSDGAGLQRGLTVERQTSSLGDFLLRVGCGASNNTVIGTLNPTTLLSLEGRVPNLRLEDTKDFIISSDGELRTAVAMPNEETTLHFRMVGDGSPFGLGVIVGNLTVQVVCATAINRSSFNTSSIRPTMLTVSENSTFPFISFDLGH